MRVDDFDFDLPKACIAQSPARPRDSARLLHVGETLADRHVRELADILQPGDLLVLNDTKVIPARLRGTRHADRGTATVDITLHKMIATAEDDQSSWLVFARPGKRLKVGDDVQFDGLPAARVMEKRDSGDILLTFGADDAAVLDGLEKAGEMPLPPYIRRSEQASEDQHDYQTIYARERGAVAAPTAGLHFTDALFDALTARGIGHVFVTMHVGAGTFFPVKVDQVADHRMHAEYGTVSPATAEQINATRTAGGRIVSVGTTSLRLIESAVDDQGRVHPFAGDTDIFITPGVPIRSADLLLTNFHLPRSTLFMLVCAFAGMDRMKAAYAHAIDTGYRFYSYGDACLLERA